MKACVIIPVYNHERAIPNVLNALKPFRLPCIIVDDGSSPACADILEQCARQQREWVTLITRRRNGGKGAAVMDGFEAAIARGFSHVLQLDADGQHDIADLGRFLDAGRAYPNALVLGNPVFDGSAPKSRRYGRQLTNLWIRINTLSSAIGDGMCGYRLYPLAAVDRLRRNVKLRPGMDFDIDISVRLYWQGVDVINIPTRVRYPSDGVSHFKLWRDNVLISKTHAALFFGMLRRLPRLLTGRPG